MAGVLSHKLRIVADVAIDNDIKLKDNYLFLYLISLLIFFTLLFGFSVFFSDDLLNLLFGNLDLNRCFIVLKKIKKSLLNQHLKMIFYMLLLCLVWCLPV
ncbi:hypothetical protein LINPERPRIM_LOCUS20212, partial [Linum perenne]